MIVGGYSLHLYCDNEGKCAAAIDWRPPSRGEYDAHTKTLAYKDARNAGWRFKNGQCFCKACKGKAIA